MYDQSFSNENLYSILKYSEWQKLNGIISKKDKVFENFQKIAWLNGKFPFVFNYSSGSKIFSNGHKQGEVIYYLQEVLIRKVYKNIKHKYRIRQANRNRIIKQLFSIMNGSYPLYLLRYDIHSFYESIDVELVYSKLEDKLRVSHTTLLVLRSILENSKVKSCNGLPRGLSISSVLSELYMEKFDLAIKGVKGVYYYARYVDDIIVFCASRESCNQAKEVINQELKKIKLFPNRKKSYYLDDKLLRSTPLEYLGYSFKKEEQVLKCSFSESKIRKIKTRIVRSFISFVDNKDFDLLYSRIRCLTGNYKFKDYKRGKFIYSGIFYANSFANDAREQLEKLDAFYQHILHCRTGKLGEKLKRFLSAGRCMRLEKLGFKYGFENRVMCNFSDKMLEEIVRIWN